MDHLWLCPAPPRFQHPVTVIYADPDPAARRRTVDELESARDEFTVDPVATPTELRGAIADVDASASVVTEYRFPETNALSMYERVRADGVNDIPFVLYTADGGERLASDAITAGLSGYVPKGLDDSSDRLLAQLRTVVARRLPDEGTRSGENEAAVTSSRSSRTRRTDRDHFTVLFEYSPDAVTVTRRGDPNRIVDVNPAFEELFGYERGAIAGDSLEDVLIPDDAEPGSEAEVVGLEDVVTTDVERLTADGRRAFSLRSFATEIDGDVYEYAIYTEISERKRRERELERYRTLVDTVGDSMYVLDSTGRIEMVNDAMAAALGESREALVGTHSSEFIPDEAVERGTSLLLEIVADDDRTWGTYEMAVESGDDDPSLVENNIAPLVEDEELVGSVGVLRNVTTRKERERQIRRLHTGTRRLMAAEGTDAVARVATQVAQNALGLRLTAVHVYDESADALVPVAGTPETEELLGTIPAIERDGGLAWDAYEAGEALAHGDVRRAPNVRNPETPMRSEAHIPIGDEGLFIVSSTEPNDFDEQALALAKILVANLEAALERARREEELAARTAELERQNDRLDDFASTVSHDLRNPLTIATGHLENLEPHVDDGGDQNLEEIAWALDRMDDLIENVLALARSGQRLTTTEPVDLGGVIHRAHRAVDPALEVVREVPLPTVEADEDRLLVCFENVFRNAREHAGDDVTITIDATEDGFAIGDDGPGVPPAERGDILESGYSTAPEGTGFGLAIVSEVIDAHGWSIAVDESEAGGLRLAVSLGE